MAEHLVLQLWGYGDGEPDVAVELEEDVAHAPEEDEGLRFVGVVEQHKRAAWCSAQAIELRLDTEGVIHRGSGCRRDPFRVDGGSKDFVNE